MVQDHLRLVLEIPVHGRISHIVVVPGKSDRLFVVTEKHQVFTIQYQNSQIVTESFGDVTDFRSRTPEYTTCILDPVQQCIGLYQAQGLFKILPNSGTNVFNVRMDKLDIRSCVFLDQDKTTLAVLSLDTRNNASVTIYEVSIDQRDLNEIYSFSVDSKAMSMIPVSKAFHGGFLLVGQDTITLYTGKSKQGTSLSFAPTIFKTWDQIDDNRFLLSDNGGNLFVLALFEGNTPLLKMDLIGQPGVATCVTYLSDGLVFLGSHYDDSKLLSLSADPDEEGQFLSVLQTLPNMAPITDFCVVKNENSSEIVACTGADASGSLKIINSGIGIEQVGEIGLEQEMQQVWGLRATVEAEFDSILVSSFINETRVQILTADGLEEQETAFVVDESTLLCANAYSDRILQVTSSKISLLSLGDGVISVFSPDASITKASSIANQCVVALNDSRLLLLDLSNDQIQVVQETKLDNEVSCLHIQQTQFGVIGALGMWMSNDIVLFSVENLQILSKESIMGEGVARSVLLAILEQQLYLFVGMGDGHLFYCTIGQDCKFEDQRLVSLGSQPLGLTLLETSQQHCVFTCSDRPTLVHCKSGRLVFLPVNLRHVSSVTGFRTALAENGVAVSAESSLIIGSIQQVQKLHVKKIPIGVTVRRICQHQNDFVILTSPQQGPGSLIVFDSGFEQKAAFQLDDHEMALSLCSLKLNGEHYIACGTAYVYPDEEEPKRGRILLFSLNDNLQLEFEQSISGCCYALVECKGKLVAAINSKVVCMELTPLNLETLSTHHGHVIALGLAVENDMIVVADLMKSMSLLRLSSETNQLVEVSRDFNTHWMTSVESVSPEIFVGAENHFNLFACRTPIDPRNEHEAKRLLPYGHWHLGDLVNRFRKGSLVAHNVESPVKPCLLFCTVNGGIGTISTVEPEAFEILEKLQESMSKLHKGIGNLDLLEFRKFQNDVKSIESNLFIDADFVESFCDLPLHLKTQVVQDMKVSDLESVEKLVEEVARAQG
ncbi:CPSF A subunit region-domain-containing protein [Gorgonomyces haynaldii]|nr:CPSF A subunit region-domain-containing protein [Gorgonomyces haynaldii]